MTAQHRVVHPALGHSAVLSLLPVRLWAVRLLPVSASTQARRRS
jgi:hypothetical protein